MGHKDKRNLYLADEGLVLENSGAAEGAAKSDMEKRVLARKDKKSKLKNPIFFVSPTRLSVRNLGRHITDGTLKSMAAAAAREGLQAGRANPQDVRLYLEAQVRAGQGRVGRADFSPSLSTATDGCSSFPFHETRMREIF